jgi:SAM-dependent methyltransferase
LRAALTGPDPDAAPTAADDGPRGVPPAAGATDGGRRAELVARGRAEARRVAGGVRRRGMAAARRVARPLLDRFAALVAREVEGELRGAVHAATVNLELLKAEVRALAAEESGRRDLPGRVHTLEVNAELVKADLRAVDTALADLGSAIAPGTGLAGAGVRLSELRERLNAVDRRVRLLADAVASGPPSAIPAERAEPAGAAAPVPAPPAATGGSGFDYVGFEQRFRGDPAEVLAVQRERYVERLRGHDPVLDVGCGRGELLRLLGDEGIEAVGVDLDAGMAAEARAAGLDAHHADALDFLRAAPEGSFGAITALHVVEHLQLDQLVELLELAATRLRPGGLLVAETPNPATLLVLGNSYVLDPTHVWPLHPSLLSFLCERAGFRSVELLFGAPATDYQLPLLPTDGPDPELARGVNVALGRLNEVLFGPQEYAVLATTPDG